MTRRNVRGAQETHPLSRLEFLEWLQGRLFCSSVTVPSPVLLHLILSVSLFTYHLAHTAASSSPQGELCRLASNEVSRSFSATQNKVAAFAVCL